jgi:hypothetical protein
MSGVPGKPLLALANDYMPELAQRTEAYTNYWFLLGGVAILGWVLVFVLQRLRSRSPTPRAGSRTAVSVRGCAVIGGSLGWALWPCLWSWGDIGIGLRWIGELSVCVLGGIGWGAAVGQFLLGVIAVRSWRRGRPENPPRSARRGAAAAAGGRSG